MIRKGIKYAALIAAVGLGGCEKALVVTNPNSGETKRITGTPDDAEALISTYYKRWYTGVYGRITDLEGMANAFSVMNYSSLANNCQNSHVPFVGATNFNTPGNTCQGEQSRLYFILGEVNRVASNNLTKMDDKTAPLSFGSVARNARARAFSEFLRGISIGYIALMYDSLSVVASGQDLLDAGKLVGYAEAAESSYVALQRAIDAATPSTATANDGFPIPATWIPNDHSTSAAEFVQMAKSYRARLRANMARTPAQRDAANWAAILADAAGGFTTDHNIQTVTSVFTAMSWRKQYETFGQWHQMTPFINGMADNSGSYASWIAQPLGDRGASNSSFTLVTPDLRFPQGATRAAQQADFSISGCATAATRCKRYFVNRPNGNDQFAGVSWGQSNYDFVKFHSWSQKGDAGSAGIGVTPVFMKAELNLLQAEGKYRLGDYAGAAALVNISRTAPLDTLSCTTTGGVQTCIVSAKGGGLPAITAFDATSPVPGGASCVPKVPQGPAFSTIGCGNLWEAIKYEKRIETAYVAYSPWYLDMRGWGDLPADVPTFWAVPYQDLQSRGVPISALYGAGVGAGNAPGSYSAKGTYGW